MHGGERMGYEKVLRSCSFPIDTSTDAAKVSRSTTGMEMQDHYSIAEAGATDLIRVKLVREIGGSVWVSKAKLDKAKERGRSLIEGWRRKDRPSVMVHIDNIRADQKWAAGVEFG